MAPKPKAYGFVIAQDDLKSAFGQLFPKALFICASLF